MGKRSSEEIEREIEALRIDTDRVLAELESRFRDTLNVRAQAERHPLLSGIAGLGLLGGIGITAYAVYSTLAHKPSAKPSERIEATSALRRVAGEKTGRGEGLAKKVLWTFITTLLVTVAGFAARRVSATLWTKTMHERPPSK